MKRRLLLLLSALAAVSLAQQAPVPIMPLGDSITDGAQFPGGYRIHLWDLLVSSGFNIEFVGSLSNGPKELPSRNHEGHSGWSIAEIDAQVQGWLDKYQPRIILLMIGTIDIVRLIDIEHAPDRLRTLIDDITAVLPDSHLIVAAITPAADPGYDEFVVQFNSFIPDIVADEAAQGKLVSFVDMHSALDPAMDLINDVHPTLDGYNKMAEVWYEGIISIQD